MSGDNYPDVATEYLGRDGCVIVAFADDFGINRIQMRGIKGALAMRALQVNFIVGPSIEFRRLLIAELIAVRAFHGVGGGRELAGFRACAWHRDAAIT